MPFEPMSPLGGFTGQLEEQMRSERDDAIDAPDFSETFGAAFRTENMIGSAASSEAYGADIGNIDYDFDPWARIANTPYEPYYEQFSRAMNEDHFEAIRADIDRENRDRDIIARSGITGIVALMAAGVLALPS